METNIGTHKIASKNIAVLRFLVFLKKLLRYFYKHKIKIIGFLYVCSITREAVWYSNFGINFYSFSSIEDSFFSLFNYLLIFTVFILIAVLFALVYNLFSSLFKRKNLLKIPLIVVFSITFFLFSNQLTKPISFTEISILLVIFSYLFVKKYYSSILAFVVIYFIAISTVFPLFSKVLFVEGKKDKHVSMLFLIRTNTDHYSFEYDDKIIDTSNDQYSLIGSTKDYFFIYQHVYSKSLIIPKNECRNIEGFFNDDYSPLRFLKK
jgi:hypothetical protein